MAATDMHETDRVLVVTRDFPAPRELVWEAWTQAEHIARWFGPRGFSTRVNENDLRSGGRWRYTMIGPDGTEYPCSGVFHEIVPLERIVAGDEFDEDFKHPEVDALPGPMVVTTTFEDLGGRTRVTIRIEHANAEDRRKHEAMGVVMGWHSTLDCLAEHLAHLRTDAQPGPEIVVRRTFDAQPETVFNAWLDAKTLGQWLFATPGGVMKRVEVEPRVGGGFVVAEQRGDELAEHFGTYLELDRPSRIVFAFMDVFSMSSTLVTVDIRPVGSGCEVTLTHRIDEKWANVAEQAREGWTGILEGLGRKLDASPEITISRAFAAPREAVWQAWTSAEHLGRWWGPRGFSTTTSRHEFRPGGVWRFVMHGPDGHDYPNQVRYTEIVEHERICYTHGGGDEFPVSDKLVIVTFEPDIADPQQTRVTLHMTFQSKEDRDFVVREVNAIEGGKQTMSRLGQYLEELQGVAGAQRSDRPFRISRVFDVPQDVMWRVWTQREHLMSWFGPKGTSVPRCTMDLKPGGAFHYAMETADGQTMWGRWVFREIQKPEKLMFVSTFSNEAGEVTRAPFDETWPAEILSTITFEPHAGLSKGTVVTIEWLPINATENEWKTFTNMFESMNMGWGGTLDKLEEYLATV